MNKKTKKILSYAICFIMITVLSMSGYSRDVKAETNNKYIAVSTGAYNTIALKSDGKVWAWGNNSNGQLGNGSTANSNIPMPVIGLDNVKIAAISAGNSHTVALDSNGKVWAWGNNSIGQLGNGSTTSSNIPLPVVGLDSVKIVAISAGRNHTVALDSYGKVWSWGYNTTNSYTPVPVPVMGLDGIKIVAVSAGNDYTIALDSAGKVWSWGNNSNGQLGNGSNTNSNTPMPVMGLDSVKITAISAGFGDAAAVDDCGRLWNWGFNANGELANSSITNMSSNVPVPATKLDNVKIVAVSEGSGYIEALDSNGGVWEWGVNAPNHNPTRIMGLDNVKITAVSSGNAFAEALDANGELWSWGHNDKGELGTGDNVNSSVPVNMNDKEDISLDKASLQIGYASGDNEFSVTQNLTFPTQGANGTSISWVSDDTTTISNIGVVTRPAAGIGNKSVNLTATITKGAVTVTKTFTVTVIRKPAAISSVTPLGSGIYRVGDTLTFKVKFDTNINVTGEPYLPISLGNTTKKAEYLNGSGTTDLTFAYTIQAGDNANGISTGNMLQLNGGSIMDAGLSVPCDLNINNVVPFNIIVDTTPLPTGITLNLKFTGQNNQSNTVTVQNFNFTSSTASNGLKQYEFDLSQNQVSEIRTAAVVANSVEVKDGSGNIIGTVGFSNNGISQMDLSANINILLPVTINGNGNFPSQNYTASINMTTLGTSKHFKVSFPQITAPGAPTNVTAVAGNGSAVVSFAQPANNGGIPIVAYQVILNGGAVVGVGPVSPIIVTGLINGMPYNFKVRAINAVGVSAESPISNSVIPMAPYIPPAPQPVTETRTVPVTVGVGSNENALGNVPVVRTTNGDGTINDKVSLDGTLVSQIIPNALKNNAPSVDIALSDSISGAASSIEFQADGNCARLLQENNLSLNVTTAIGSLSLPYTTLRQLAGTPMQAAFSRTSDSRTPSIISQYAAGAKQVGTSLKLDTNFSGDADVILPITADELQQGSVNFLSRLAVMIQHSDGQNEVVRGNLVYGLNNKVVGVGAHVKKFSTFTLIELPDSNNDEKVNVIPYKVNSDKVWTVKFSNDIDKTTVNKANVYVVDDEGNKVDVKLECSGKALIISPVENYKSGHKYHLHISNKVQSVNKKTLKKALDYEFNVI